MDDFEEMYKDRDDKYVCLMDMALMAMKRLKKMEFLTIWKKAMRSTPAALLYQ